MGRWPEPSAPRCPHSRGEGRPLLPSFLFGLQKTPALDDVAGGHCPGQALGSLGSTTAWTLGTAVGALSARGWHTTAQGPCLPFPP